MRTQNHFEQAKEAARRLYKKVNFQGGNLQNYELSSLMQQTYDYLKIPFKPTTNDIKEYSKVLDANNDGSVSLQDLETLAVSYLCGEGVLAGVQSGSNKSLGFASDGLAKFNVGESYSETSSYIQSNSGISQNNYGVGSSYKAGSLSSMGGRGNDYSSSIYLNNDITGSSYKASSTADKYGSYGAANTDYLSGIGSSTSNSYLKNKSSADPYANDYSDPNFLKNIGASSNTSSSYGMSGYDNNLKSYSNTSSYGAGMTDFSSKNYGGTDYLQKNNYGLSNNDYSSNYGSKKSYDYSSTASNAYDFSSSSGKYNNNSYAQNDYSAAGSTATIQLGSDLAKNYSYTDNMGNNDYSSYDHQSSQQQSYTEQPIQQESSSRYTQQAQNYLNMTRRLFYKHCDPKTETITRNGVAELLTETYETLGRSGYHPNDEDVNVWMKLCDTNGDGHVEEAEYEYFVIRALQRSGVQVNNE